MPENKVVYGLKNAYYAVATEGTNGSLTYTTPVRLPGATSLVLNAKGEQTDFYADDMLYYTASTNQGYDATLTLAAIPEAFRKDVLGEELSTTDKVLTEKSTVVSKKIALLFEFDGDVKATRHVLYYCSVSRPGISSSTKTTVQNPGTSELVLVASPRPSDGVVKRSTTAETTPTVYSAWYTSVYSPAA